MSLDDLKRQSQPIINTVPDKKKRFGGVKTLTDTDSSGKERKYHYARQYTTRPVPSGRKGVIGDKQGGTTLRLKEDIIFQKDIDKPCRHCSGRMGKPFDDYKKNRITMTCTKPDCKATGTVYIKHGKPARPYTPSNDRMTIEGPRGGLKKVVNPDAICHGCGTNKIGTHTSPDKSKCRECNVWRSEGGTFKHKALDDLMKGVVDNKKKIMDALSGNTKPTGMEKRRTVGMRCGMCNKDNNGSTICHDCGQWNKMSSLKEHWSKAKNRMSDDQWSKHVERSGNRDYLKPTYKSVSAESITEKRTKMTRSEHKSIPETKTKPEALTTTGF